MRCAVCNQNSWAKLYDSLVRCQNCGFIRARDKYHNLNPKKLYGPRYFFGIDYFDYQRELPALTKNFSDRLKRILEFKKDGWLLEIGCAYGYFLQLAEEYFQTTGIDLNPEITKRAKESTKKSKITTGDFLKIKFPQSSFDVVCLFDTIEHLKRPDRYLEKIYSLLKPGGIIVIETGDIKSPLARLQGKKWRLITPPTHLSYFSQKSLSSLLYKKGFAIKNLVYVPFTRTVGQTLFRLIRSKKLPKIFMPILGITYSVNSRDILFLIAQKPDRNLLYPNINGVI